ncbi:hypothetical protein AYO20_11716 [Fonsecaea nubica]|uniref:BZIP domain-containing protein n=1 Tax=Fonsecaea nubica TaxID=856822 RepID=A0A178BP91_9EURO|nr:hypothetical protein AYO20_11716 [Fonsecaea nubica]OAL18675.1 hypothetical protein AYO20_11716 [Fonsecaea nubica]
MDTSHIDSLPDISKLTPSELFLVDPSEFGDLDLLDEIHQFGSLDVPDIFSSDADGSVALNGLTMIGDVDASAMEQSNTSTSTDSEPPAESRTKMRRRAQNRASQRAFRERKEKHLRNLKATLEQLGQKHRRLLDSYSQQAETVTKLKSQIAHLRTQIAAFSMFSEQDMMASISRVPRTPSTEFQQFDAFPLSPPLSVSAEHQSLFCQSRTMNGSGAESLPTPDSLELPEFEDLLHLP